MAWLRRLSILLRGRERFARELEEEMRFHLEVLGVFGMIALALMATGIYGVTAYAVRVRTREIGIRMALGADRRQVLAALLLRGAWLAGAGIALGAAGALATGRVLAASLYQVSPADAATFSTAALLVAAACLLACYLPARRAAGVNPVEVLRYE